MIQTSYFGSKAPKERKVCIAKWHRFWKGPRANLFAPSNPKAKEWAGAYSQDLEYRFRVDGSLQEYLATIEKETPNPILCCFEKDGDECHRRILAAFIQKRLGIEIPEWQDPNKKIVQCSLLA